MLGAMADTLTRQGGEKEFRRGDKTLEFMQMLEDGWRTKDSLVCVGLDTDIGKIPLHLRKLDHPLFQFNRAVVDATADLVCAYKPQIAYYSAVGAEHDLELTIEYIHQNYPSIPVILDAKRGDIGATAEKYAEEAFDRYRADAVTVNPYMGGDTLQPYLARKDKGVIILCRTSNAGARDIQDVTADGRKLYQIVAGKAVNSWNDNGNALLVVGATFPEELKEIRAIAPEMPFLVPGIGAQGGDVKAAVTNGRTKNGAGMIVNSSRAIIYASADEDFADAARRAAASLRDEINRYRT